MWICKKCGKLNESDHAPACETCLEGRPLQVLIA